MLLTRAWSLVLSFLTAAGIAAAYLACGDLQTRSNHHEDVLLSSHQWQIEMWLNKQAMLQIGWTTAFAADDETIAGLRRASQHQSKQVGSDLMRSVRSALRRVNNNLEPSQKADLVLAVNAAGTIVAALGVDELPSNAALDEMPLVRKALEGYLRDDVWVFGEDVYRVAARPVLDRGQYVGAVVHGLEIDDNFARNLGEKAPGSAVGFFFRNRMVAGYLPPGNTTGTRELWSQPLEQLLLENESLKQGRPTVPVDLAGGLRAMYQLVTGSASFAQVGYVVVRRAVEPIDPWSLLLNADQHEVMSLLPMVIGIVGVGFAATLLFMFIERDRPLSVFIRSTKQLASKERDRLAPADFNAPLRTIAIQINDALDQAGYHASGDPKPSRPADINEILGPTLDEEPAQPYFGFASQVVQEEEVPKAPLAALEDSKPGIAFEGLGVPAQALGEQKDTHERAQPQPQPLVPATADPKDPPSNASAAHPHPSEDQFPRADFTDGDDDEGATMIAQIPKELIEASMD
ncbi:MAG: cache domain-containing protein, partial [Myxococcota bacterium]